MIHKFVYKSCIYFHKRPQILPRDRIHYNKGQRGRDYDNRSRVAPAAAWPMKVKSVFRGAQNIYNLKSNLNVDKSKLSDEEETDTNEESRLLHQQQQNLIYDEYESFNHNCLVMIANNETKCVGICLFLLDRKVEYYVEDIPSEIQSEIKSSSRTNEDEVLARGLKTTLHGISQWSDQWCAAESVNLLLKDKDVVLKLNSDPDIEEAAKTVSDLALLNGFKIYCQWSDNFICDTVANEELWEGLIICCDHLLKGDSVPWIELGPSEDWQRRKIHLNMQS